MMSIVNRKATWLAAIAAFIAVGCATSPSVPSPVPPVANGSNGAEIDPSSYQIGPGDVLDIFVWRNPEISTKVPVRPDGKISTPLVEDMVACG